MTTIIFLIVTFAAIPAAAMRFGADSRNLLRSDPRSLVS
jgi:hypothetical protein